MNPTGLPWPPRSGGATSAGSHPSGGGGIV